MADGETAVGGGQDVGNDEYQHAVFFEANFLSKKDKERIRTHFQIKRNGGGECGQVEKVGEKTYRIAFMDQRVQERVLDRREQVISLPGRELRITVSHGRPPSDPTHTAPPSDNKQTPTSRREPEKVVKMNQYLLQYLKDCPKAAKALNKQLDSISSSVQLHPEKEEAVVKGVAAQLEPSVTATWVAWMSQVERIFDDVKNKYHSHFEMDPGRLKILWQNITALETEDVRVYREENMFAVVVGETSEVNKSLNILKEMTQTRKNYPILERQYNLVKEELERELKILCPRVKISKNGPDALVLEGPDKEIQLGLTKLEELINSIKEKRVKLPKALMDFMVSSKSVFRYQARFQQSLRNPVALETGLDLRLSSLSTNVLEEAATAILKDLRLDTQQLDGALGLSPALDKLKQSLRKVQDEANVAGPKVEVRYQQGSSGDPRTTVQLLGYSEEVGRLKEVLLSYKLNQAVVHESLPLHFPEMVDSFDKVKDLMGLKLKPDVKLKPSHFPRPSVGLSGPRCLVQEVLQDLNAGLTCMTWQEVVLDEQGALNYYLGEGKKNMELVESSCSVLIWPQQDRQVRGAAGSTKAGSATTSTRRSRPDPAVIQARLEVVLGSVEDQQVDVLVASMVKTQLMSTRVGHSLISRSSHVQTNFDLAAGGRSRTPGEVLEVKLPSAFRSGKVFFIECVPWDAAQGQSEMALRTGLSRVLDLCRQQGLSSVALPVIGPGQVLMFPLREAVRILTEEIGKFGCAGPTGSISTIRVVIKPGYPDSNESFQDVQRGLSSKMVNWKGKVVFSSLTSDLDDITLGVGGVQVQLVFGDITNETTDMVVNTTDFVDLKSGVCKDILTMAGSVVETELRSAHVNRGGLFESKPGAFPCKSIVHVCGEKSTSVIRGLIGDIMKRCEQKGYQSVAIPAICSGKGGLDPKVVADTILQGVQAAASSTPLRHLSLVRLVLIKVDVFLAFKHSSEQLFPSTAFVNQTSNSPRSLQPQLQSTSAPDLSILLPTSSSPDSPSRFLVLGLDDLDVSKGAAELQRVYQAQCCQHSFSKEDLAGLNQDEVDELSREVASLGLTVELQDGGQGQSLSTQTGLTISGLKDGVNKVVQQVQGRVQGSLRRSMREREQDEMYARVTWCMMGPRGDWERIPKEANLQLEKGEVQAGVADWMSGQWRVDLTKMEITDQGSGRVAKLKRLENIEDFSLPLEWDSMASGESLKRVDLPTSSMEFHRVKEDFRRTASNKTVLKIERIQNVHLRQAYEVRKKQLEDKVGAGRGAGEKLLYHGTTKEASRSILETGFNRSFAGQNATCFGLGTYFAVNADYSTNPTYSQPDQDGNQLMFVARILTGLYTLGKRDMRVPPAGYDSLVDKVQCPTMFVVFNDIQAYPDYLITFK